MRPLPSPRSSLRVLAALVAVCAVVLGLSACRVQPGAAAFVGDDRIAEADVAQYLSPTASPSTAPAQPTTLSPRAQVLSTLVASKLVRVYLDQNGGVPSATALDADRSAAFQLLTGGDFPGYDQFRQVLVGLGFDAAFAEVYVGQIELQYVAVGRSKAASYADLAKIVSEAGPAPRISPRYGSWDAAQLSLTGSTATPDYLTLSTTAAA